MIPTPSCTFHVNFFISNLRTLSTGENLEATTLLANSPLFTPEISKKRRRVFVSKWVLSAFPQKTFILQSENNNLDVTETKRCTRERNDLRYVLTTSKLPTQKGQRERERERPNKNIKLKIELDLSIRCCHTPFVINFKIIDDVCNKKHFIREYEKLAFNLLNNKPGIHNYSTWWQSLSVFEAWGRSLGEGLWEGRVPQTF